MPLFSAIEQCCKSSGACAKVCASSGGADGQVVQGPLSLCFLGPRKRTGVVRIGTTPREQGLKGPFSLADRQSASVYGPEWAALKKHRHRETRPVQAVQPVSEGLKMPSRQVVRQTGCADGIAAPRVRWGVLMGIVGYAGRQRAPREPRVAWNAIASSNGREVINPASSSKHLGGARKHVVCFHPWGNYV